MSIRGWGSRLTVPGWAPEKEKKIEWAGKTVVKCEEQLLTFMREATSLLLRSEAGVSEYGDFAMISKETADS